MHIHILGICGTFMGGVAALAKEAGHRVTGCDANVYPPMSSQLEAQGIALTQGFDAAQVKLNPDIFVIGNVVSRGNALMEEILNRGLPYISGPQWLADSMLRDKWVLAVAGTHGKTTTSAMLTWILEHAGLNPGFLIGGVPQNFAVSARLPQSIPSRPASKDESSSPFFVIEADEYDTAFFDKRSKFVHYRPRTAILNNLEYDHADIFPDLAAIETQFHHLLRTIPGHGLVVANGDEESLRRMEVRGTVNGVTVYDDFAHHPTAIETTVAGLRRKVGAERIIAVLEPRSNTMKLGVMKAQLPSSLKDADVTFCYTANLGWDAGEALTPLGTKAALYDDLGVLVEAIARIVRPGDHVLVMSNGGFGGVHDKLLARLSR